MSRNRGDASVDHTAGPLVRSSADAYAGSVTSGPRDPSHDTAYVLGGAAAAVNGGGDVAGAERADSEPVVELAGSDGAPLVVTTDGPDPD